MLQRFLKQPDTGRNRLKRFPGFNAESVRNQYTTRSVVTLEKIATCTDVTSIECLLFMRDVMKGRDTRVLNKDDMQKGIPKSKDHLYHK